LTGRSPWSSVTCEARQCAAKPLTTLRKMSTASGRACTRCTGCTGSLYLGKLRMKFRNRDSLLGVNDRNYPCRVCTLCSREVGPLTGSCLRPLVMISGKAPRVLPSTARFFTAWPRPQGGPARSVIHIQSSRSSAGVSHQSSDVRLAWRSARRPSPPAVHFSAPIARSPFGVIASAPLLWGPPGASPGDRSTLRRHLLHN